MNKTAIRNFAVWARRKLIADVSYRASLIGITENGISEALSQSTDNIQFFDIGMAEPYSISGDEIKQRKSLVDTIKNKEKDSDYETAYKSVIEEVAYTWFNRLIAIRFMEVNDYMPAHIRVLSSESGKLEPDIVTTPFDAELAFMRGEEQGIIALKNDNKLDALFRILFIKQCNALYPLLPRLFENLSDYTELLLNVSFIDRDGVVYHLTHDIPEEDFNVELGGQVEIIGWLYQYYNAELKDETFALIKQNVKVTKERVPSATQLFTPDWIVRYMVENSLGRLWIEGHPNDSLKSEWKYYLDETEQEESVKNQLLLIRKEYSQLNPEDIMIIDPCMGSGHILVYAFDVLIQIYESAGYTKRDATKSILENNLYGLDIDERAAQLAYFAVMMKARQYNRHILNEEVSCNVTAIYESNSFDRNSLRRLGDLQGIGEKLIDAFLDAKEYGSILKLDINLNEIDTLRERLEQIEKDTDYGDLFSSYECLYLLQELGKYINQAIMIEQKYHLVITNPPYMGNGNMSPKLSELVKNKYPDSKTDLYAVFDERIVEMLTQNGLAGLMTSYTWMFLTSFERFRNKLLNDVTIESLVQPEYHAFFESANVPICTFIIRKYRSNAKGTFVKLDNFYGADKQQIYYLKSLKGNCEYKYYSCTNDFKSIPGMPIAYWLSQNTIDLFSSDNLMGKYVELKQGLITGDNDRFLRLWQECSSKSITISGKELKKWFFFHKGGEYRKWYGNIYLVVNWENNGEEIINFKDSKGKQKSRPQNVAFYFKEGFTWTSLTVADFNVRYMPEGAIFAAKGSAGFCKNQEYLKYMIGLCNSKPIMVFLSFLSPTMDYNNGAVAKVPTLIDDIEKETVSKLVEQNIQLSKKDWDSFEESWDFKKHPLV